MGHNNHGIKKIVIWLEILNSVAGLIVAILSYKEGHAAGIQENNES